MWMHARRVTALAALAVLVSTPWVAASLPSVQTVTDVDGDTTVTLRQLTSGIVGDAAVWCELRVQVADFQLPFSSGDSVSMWVYEDDTTADELVWSSSFVLSATEVSTGNVDRTFDCAGTLGSDAGSEWEVYAEVEVDKAACGSFCFPDNPITANLIVQQVVDDAAEDDDVSGQAVPVSPGVTTDRVANDGADWITFELASTSRVGGTVVHEPGVGGLEATLLDETLAVVAVFDRTVDATVASEVLPAGAYFVVIRPDDAGDPNFYDFALSVGAVAVPASPPWLQAALLLILLGSGKMLWRRRTDNPSRVGLPRLRRRARPPVG